MVILEIDYSYLDQIPVRTNLERDKPDVGNKHHVTQIEP